MKVLSLFSGVGGFDLGLEAAGMTTVAMCEWDKKAASVLRGHWPNIPIYGDVSDLTGEQLIKDGVYPDLVAFGSPCQDLSVAGKRAGLQGERSGLFHEAIRIIRELRDLTNGSLPRWIIWENVAGALSSNNGKDFGAVLGEMDELGAYYSEWALLDAQNYGVPQRRRRVFLVACLDSRAAESSPDPLLPIRKGGPRDLTPLREAWKNTAGGIAACLRSGGDGGVPSSRGEHLVSIIDGTRVDDVRVYEEPVQTLKARMGTGGNAVPLVMRQREGKPGGGKGPLVSEQSLTIATANDQTLFQSVNFDEMNFTGGEDVHHTLRVPKHSTGVALPLVSVHGEGGFGAFVEDRIATLKRSGGVLGGGSETLVATTYGFSHTQGLDAQPSHNAWPTLRREGNGHAVMADYAVRRLTPLECERLMGWPDDWTRWRDDGKEQADTNRYKQIGNGVASPVAEWVGRQIFAADALR